MARMRRLDDERNRELGVPLYRITWRLHGGGCARSLIPHRLFTWEEVEHEISFDDHERSTTWEEVG